MTLRSAFLLACLAAPALAQPPLKPPLADVAFLVGQWKADDGKVADTGETSRGTSVITIEADGNALLRRDTTQTFKNGKPGGRFSQLMTIYAEAGSLRADYVDGEGHVIHYASADVTPGKAVTFTSAPGAGPSFRLRYELQSPRTLAVQFGMIAPGQITLHPIASGTLRRAR